MWEGRRACTGGPRTFGLKGLVSTEIGQEPGQSIRAEVPAFSLNEFFAQLDRSRGQRVPRILIVGMNSVCCPLGAESRLAPTLLDLGEFARREDF
jgi:hypothetical protein